MLFFTVPEQCVYPLFKVAYTQSCIYPLFSRKVAYTPLYTPKIFRAENNLLESCFYLYFLFSAPQAPPNAILHHLIQFPFIFNASRHDIIQETSIIVLKIMYIHISKTSQTWIYTNLHIHIFFLETCIYTTPVYMRLCIYIWKATQKKGFYSTFWALKRTVRVAKGFRAN